MKTKRRKFYLTTAIDYVNSLPHLGTAYEKIGADVLARFARRLGYEVHFQMGNDEHSINVSKAAEQAGLAPKEYCDQMRRQFESIWRQLEISYDDFIQTSEPRHHRAAQALFKRIYEAGDIERGHYEGWYCESCEAYYTEKDLIDGHCPHHKVQPKWLKQENYFFKLSRFQKPLLEHYKNHPEFILPEIRRNEIIRLVESGLQDISISRADAPWGIPIPMEYQQTSEERRANEVIYVWFEALINYLTAVGYPDDPKRFKKLWPADVHVIGKDITRFHCVIWPAMLLSAKLPLPKIVFGHGFIYLKGEKMSKTLGNIVTPLDIVPHYGADALRYYLLATSSFGADGDFTWEGFIQRYNSDLANDLGNLVNRTVGMAYRYDGGHLYRPKQNTSSESNRLRELFANTKQTILQAMDPMQLGPRSDLKTHDALNALWTFLSQLDRTIDKRQPWALHKEGKTEQVREVLFNLAASLRVAAILLEPFLPQTAQKIWERLGLKELQDFNKITYDRLEWNDLPDRFRVQTGDPLFPRIEEETKTMTAPKTTTPTDNQISLDEFAKVDLRIARIVTAERIAGADKLLRLEIDLGNERRQLVAGIAKSYDPESLIGKQIVVVANLKEAVIRGVKSKGMLLAAGGPEGVVLLSPEKEVPVGSPIK